MVDDGQQKLIKGPDNVVKPEIKKPEIKKPEKPIKSCSGGSGAPASKDSQESSDDTPQNHVSNPSLVSSQIA